MLASRVRLPLLPLKAARTVAKSLPKVLTWTLPSLPGVNWYQTV